MKKQLFSLLALLLMAAGSAMAQNENSVNVRELTKNAQGNWVLNSMPGWNGMLQITLKEAYRLDSIPLTWTVMVAGVDKSAQVTAYTAEEGPDTLGWLNVLEGDTVELVPPTVVKPTVKSVTLVEPVAAVPANTPDIAQANCTFSPSNGKSTLSNANITTSMEYSADNGTTWTDVTSNGSIASLAAGTVQIRVKETVDNLASEAVSITVPEVLHINEIVGPYTGDRLTCEYYAGETWQALVDRYDLIKVYSGRAAFGTDGFIYDESTGSAVLVTALVDNTKTYEVQ